MRCSSSVWRLVHADTALLRAHRPRPFAELPESGPLKTPRHRREQETDRLVAFKVDKLNDFLGRRGRFDLPAPNPENTGSGLVCLGIMTPESG